VVGRGKEPLATPSKLCNRWVWQVDGQWWRIRSQVSAEVGRVPSCGSVAEPEKPITSPTFQVVPAAGVLMVAVGGVLPTVSGAEPVVGLALATAVGGRLAAV
jgi:hypothetical protein